MSSDHTARPAKAPEDEVQVLWKRGRGGDLAFCSEAWRSCPLPRPMPGSSAGEAWDPKAQSEAGEFRGAHPSTHTSELST